MKYLPIMSYTKIVFDFTRCLKLKESPSKCTDAHIVGCNLKKYGCDTYNRLILLLKMV